MGRRDLRIFLLANLFFAFLLFVKVEDIFAYPSISRQSCGGSFVCGSCPSSLGSNCGGADNECCCTETCYCVCDNNQCSTGTGWDAQCPSAGVCCGSNPTATPTPTPDPYYTIAGFMRDKSTGDGISNATVTIYDNNKSDNKTILVTTDASGYFASPHQWAMRGDTYAVRPLLISGAYTPPISTTGTTSFNQCYNADQPLGSMSYECQRAESNDCSMPGSDGLGRCNFEAERYYAISGFIRDKDTGQGIENVIVKVYDNTKQETKTVSTGGGGFFRSPDQWAVWGDTYAVRPETPDGYTGAPSSVTDVVSYNFCYNIDQPLGSPSYECQRAGSSDCSIVDSEGSGRCSFVLTKPTPTPTPTPTLTPTATPTLSITEVPLTITPTEPPAEVSCPIPADEVEGRIIVNITDSRFILSMANEDSTKDQPGVTVSNFGVISAGFYNITLASYDNHTDKTDQNQTGEQYFLKLLNVNDPDFLLETNSISDLPEVDENGNVQNYLVEQVNTGFNVEKNVNSITAYHKWYPSDELNSVIPVCAAFDPVIIRGDANGDGLVNGVDYVVWLNHYNTITTLGPAVGDFNNSGKVNGVDYVVWLNNYGYGR